MKGREKLRKEPDISSASQMQLEQIEVIRLERNEDTDKLDIK